MGDLSERIHITTYEDDEDYVFVSYRSKNRDTMEEIIYHLQKEHGLRVYYDKSFESHNSSWIRQFANNMNSNKCKAIIVFLSNDYYYSYATLMELMHSRCPKAQTNNKDIPIIPIIIERINISCDDDDRNIGLGVKDFENGDPNNQWKDELHRFNLDFKAAKKKYADIEDYYESEKVEEACDPAEPYLNWGSCREIIRIFLNGTHDKRWYEKKERGEVELAQFYKSLADAIRDEKKGAGPTVFGKPQKQESVKAQKSESKSSILTTEEKVAKLAQYDPMAERNQKEAPAQNGKPSAESYQSEDKKAKYEPGIWEYRITSGEIDAAFTQYVDENGKDYKYILHAGSRISKTVAASTPSAAKKRRQELEDEEKVIDAVVKVEVEFTSASALGCFCRGGSESGTRFIEASKQMGEVNEVKAEVPASSQQLSVESEQSEGKKTKYEPGIWEYTITSGEIDAAFTQYVDENGKDYKYILHAGSRVSKTVVASTPSAVKKRRQELADEGKIIDAVVKADVEFTSASALGCFCRGGSESGTRFIKASKWID